MTAKTDAKRRIVLPGAEPGDVYDVQRQDDRTYMLVKLNPPERPEALSREACLRAMAAAPLRLAMTWDELASLTREP